MKQLALNSDEKQFVLNWGKEGLCSLLSIDGFKNNIPISVCLYFHHFLIEIELNSSEVSSIYDHIKKIIQNTQSHLSFVVDFYFLQYSTQHKIQLPEFDVSNLCWDFGSSSVEIFLTNSIQQNNFEQILKYSSQIFHSTLLDQKKLEIFQLLSKFDSEIELTDPFDISVKFVSPYIPPVNALSLVEGEFMFYLPSWLPQENLKLTFTFSSKITHESIHFSIETSLFQVVRIPLSFPSEDQWNFEEFSLLINLFKLSWTISSKFPNLFYKVLHPAPILFDVTFPIITSIDSNMEFFVNCNFSHIYNQLISLQLFFESENSIIHDQNGKNSLGTYQYSEKILSFSFSPCLQSFLFSLEFRQLQALHSSKLFIKTKIGNYDFNFAFPINLDFPINCTTRLVSSDLAHICLTNISSKVLYLERVEIGEEKWPSRVIQPSHSSFLIVHTNQKLNEEISYFAKEENGPLLNQRFNLSFQTCIRVIQVEIQKEIFLGQYVEMKFELSSCDYKIISNTNVLINGQTSVQKFQGGTVSIYLIPIALGNLSLPTIEINSELYSTSPTTIFVTFPKHRPIIPLISAV